MRERSISRNSVKITIMLYINFENESKKVVTGRNKISSAVEAVPIRNAKKNAARIKVPFLRESNAENGRSARRRF